MPAISLFPAALDATLQESADERRRSAQVVGVAMDDANGQPAQDRLMFVVVDHDGHGRLVSAAQITFTDDKVMPPKYG
jgi:hypothetical protein